MFWASISPTFGVQVHLNHPTRLNQKPFPNSCLEGKGYPLWAREPVYYVRRASCILYPQLYTDPRRPPKMKPRNNPKGCPSVVLGRSSFGWFRGSGYNSFQSLGLVFAQEPGVHHERPEAISNPWIYGLISVKGEGAQAMYILAYTGSRARGLGFRS